jgi:uncharacterized protein
MITADKGYLNSMRALVEVRGVNVNTAGFDQLTPMHLASRADFGDGIRYLHQKGANLGSLDKDDMSPLHQAAINGALEAMRTLVDLGAILERTDRFGGTPLDLFKAFIEQQGSLSHNKDRYDRETRAEIFALLTPSFEDEKESKSTEKPGKLEDPASTKAVTSEKPKPVQTTKGLQFADTFYQQMFNRIRRLDPEAITDYLSYGGDPNYEYPDGYTLLMCLAERGLTKMMETLINAGADVNKSGQVGSAPIHLAASCGSVSALSLLSAKGVNIEQGDRNGSRALHKAIWAGQLPAILRLLHLGADYIKECCPRCKTVPRTEFVKLLQRLVQEHGKLPEHFTNASGASMVQQVKTIMSLT